MSDAVEQSRDRGDLASIPDFRTWVKDNLGDDKADEIGRYEDLLGVIKGKYPNALKPMHASHTECIYGTPSLERIMRLVESQPDYHAVLLTSYGIYDIDGLAEGKGLGDYIEAIIPVIRGSYEKEVPDYALEIDHPMAAVHPERGTKRLYLARVLPNSKSSMGSLASTLQQAEETFLRSKDESSWATLGNVQDAAGLLEQD